MLCTIFCVQFVYNILHNNICIILQVSLYPNGEMLSFQFSFIAAYLFCGLTSCFKMKKSGKEPKVGAELVLRGTSHKTKVRSFEIQFYSWIFNLALIHSLTLLKNTGQAWF